jgi:ATP-dependent Lon protease
MLNKLKNSFSEMVVFKSPEKGKFFNALSLPSFMRDWLLMKFSDDNGAIDKEEVSSYVKKVIPKKEQWEQLKFEMTHDGQSVRFLAKVKVEIDIATRRAYFSLPDFAAPKKKNEAIVENEVIEANKNILLSPNAVWGIIELICEKDYEAAKNTTVLKMTDFSPFCPYEIDLEYFCEARKSFTTDEWINILLAAIDYNPEGYASETQKLTMLSRLLPFVEKRVNLIELAPKGTGKSYLFSQLSKYGWLVSGGSISRAKMFYDIGKRTHGLVSHYDFIAFDEVQSITFPDKSEMQGALKGYLESPTGEYRVGDGHGNGESGLVLLGNIKEENMNVNINMFLDLPSFFYEDPALLDRFHGFIKGWDIPRMKENLKVNGWALNVEYFSEIMHMMRSEMIYRAIVDDVLDVPKTADTRDSEAVKRICTGFMKLLFPQVKKTQDVDAVDFDKYCLQPALKMRGIILAQLGIMDAQFRGKRMPDITIKELIMKKA